MTSTHIISISASTSLSFSFSSSFPLEDKQYTGETIICLKWVSASCTRHTTQHLTALSFKMEKVDPARGKPRARTTLKKNHPTGKVPPE